MATGSLCRRWVLVQARDIGKVVFDGLNFIEERGVTMVS